MERSRACARSLKSKILRALRVEQCTGAGCENTFKQGELDAKTICHSTTVCVEQFVMETSNAKPSLLHFLC